MICDSSISRIHARLHIAEREDITIEDLGSRNGVDINGKLSKFGPLRLNDRLRLGAVPCLITSHRQLCSYSFDDDAAHGGIPALEEPQLRIDDNLSRPQVEVLQLIAKGLTEDEVAHQTGRSYHAVHNHVRTIYKVYGVHSRDELLSQVKDGPRD